MAKMLLPLICLVVGLAAGEEAKINCDFTSAYRTFDGTCNNKVHPEWGKTNTPHRRILPPAYDNNDGNTPRYKAASGAWLPNVRTVSRFVHNQLNHSQPTFNVMQMQWGQFLDHDLTHTALMNSSTLCCSNPNVFSRDFIHPDIKSNGPCDPIIVPRHDPYFDTDDKRCMEFTRSVGVKDKDGVRQQINELTPWIDGSHIYGQNKQLADELRSFQGGRLKSKMINGSEFLPEWTDDTQCFKLFPGDYCFRAGDIRVNHYAGLSAMHTVFLRYHNKLAGRLSAKHPDWTDEKLYQEARKIVGALMQKITYNEFLLALFGYNNAEKKDLLQGDFDYAYDPSIDPTLSNVFATAAFRYGHSAIPDSLTVDGEEIPTGQLFMRPNQVLNHLDGIVKALISQPQQRVDIWYTDGVNNQLFEPPGKPGHGFDLAAFNVMRGRDHGIPPYTAWRKVCGLPNITDFSQVGNGGKAFIRFFESVHDIDLYSGALSEHPGGAGSWVGPLYLCLLSEQFRNLKFADRFYYENQADPTTAFTSNQIWSINKVRLAAILCQTTDIKEAPPNVFRQSGGRRNGILPCSQHKDIDIENYW